jgi:hypothetical protein
MSPEFRPPAQPQAKALQQAVLDTWQRVQSAHKSYIEALDIAAEIDCSDGSLLVRQQGNDYREAVKLYSDAVAVWLAFVNTLNEDPNRT